MGRMTDENAAPGAVERLYDVLVEEEDARVCIDIPDAACSDVPANFFRITASQSLTKVADELASAKTVLLWLMGAVGAPEFWVAFLVPLRESLSMLPQMIIAGQVRRVSYRKHVWVAGAVAQAVALGALALVAAWCRGAWAGPAILGLLILFSLARGLCSIAFKDVVGKTVPKTRRGRLTGYAATLSGLLTLGVSGVLLAMSGASASPWFFPALLSIAGVLWILAAGSFASISETPGATEGGNNALSEAFKMLSILRTDASFRRFVVVRALLISTGLAAPYYVVLAREAQGAGASLGAFVLASGLAAALSSAFWGRYADRSSRAVLVMAAGGASALGLCVSLLHFAGLLTGVLVWAYPLAFFLLAVAHSGVRVGRKTYILDLAGGQKRTDYVAVSNSTIGAILLLSGALGALTPLIGPAGMLLLLSCIGAAGALLGRALPEA